MDVGQDPAIFASIERAPTGVGKWPVEQVVLTHGHYDHSALLPRIREVFHPKVFAFSPNIEGVDGLLRDGDTVKMGDAYFEIIHTPGHSSDSICLYNQSRGSALRRRFAAGDHIRRMELMKPDFSRRWRRFAPAMSGASTLGTGLR